MTEIKILGEIFNLPDTEQEWLMCMLDGTIRVIDDVTSALDQQQLAKDEYEQVRSNVIIDFNKWLVRNMDKYEFHQNGNDAFFICKVFNTRYHIYKGTAHDQIVWDYLENEHS